MKRYGIEDCEDLLNGDKRNIIQKTDALLRPKDIVVIKDKIIAKQI